MLGRDLSDVLLLIPCCGSKKGDGRWSRVRSAPLDTELSKDALCLLEGGRSVVAEEYRDRFDLASDLLPATQWYTGNPYKVTGFRDSLYGALERGMRCLIVSAGYGLLRPDDPIQYYNVKMSDKGIKKIWKGRLPQILEDYVSRNGVRSVFGALSRNYYEAVADLQNRLSNVDLCVPPYDPHAGGAPMKQIPEAVGRAVIDLVASDFKPCARWGLAPIKNVAASASPPTSVKGKDAVIARPLPAEAERVLGYPPRKPDFEAALAEIFTQAERAGQPYVDIQAGELHKRVGGYPSPDGNHRMPLCCRVMYGEMEPGDELLCAPRSGQGTAVKIRYVLPRSWQRKREGE